MRRRRYSFICTGLSSGWMDIQISSLPLVSLGIGRDHYLTREQVAKAWRETTQVFLVIEGSALAEWKSYLGSEL